MKILWVWLGVCILNYLKLSIGSYSQKEDTNLSKLNKARRKFTEVIRRGSEPGFRFFNEGKITENWLNVLFELEGYLNWIQIKTS